MPFELTDKRLVLTGGTSGIGLEMVRLLSRTNDVTVLGRDPEKLAFVAERFGVTPVRANLTNGAELEAAAEAIRRRTPEIDALINCAAVQHTPRFIDEDFRYETIAEEIDVNLTSPCRLTYLLLPALLKNSPSVVLNLNSGLALAPKTGSAIYCATKGAVDVFSRSLRYQLEDTNIAVAQAFLPLVDTPMTAGRGSGKLTAAEAARRILRGVERGIDDHDIGKVKLLRLLLRLSPSLGRAVAKRLG